MFADDPLPKRPNFNEADVSDKPRWLRELFPELTPAEIDLQTQSYRDRLGSLLAVGLLH